jgi:hypothetical protein
MMRQTPDFEDQLDQLLELEKNRKPSPFAGTRIMQRLENEVAQNRPVPVYYRTRILQPVLVACALVAGIFIGSHLSEFQQNAVPETSSVTEVEQMRNELFIGDLTQDDHVFQFNNEQP